MAKVGVYYVWNYSTQFFFSHTVPHNLGNDERSESYHWHLKICPRAGISIGFELVSGLFVTTTSPEETAKKLREVKLDI